MKSIGFQKIHVFEEFLFRANSAFVRLLNIEYLSQICINQYIQRKPLLTTINTSKFVFWSSAFVQLLNEIPPFFSDMRILQDRLLNLLNATLIIKKLLPIRLIKAL